MKEKNPTPAKAKIALRVGIAAALLGAGAAGTEVSMKNRQTELPISNTLVQPANMFDHQQVIDDATNFNLDPKYSAIPNPRTGNHNFLIRT